MQNGAIFSGETGMLSKDELIYWQGEAAKGAPEEPGARAEKLADLRELRTLDTARALRFWLWFGPLLAIAIWQLVNGLANLFILAKVR